MRSLLIALSICAACGGNDSVAPDAASADAAPDAFSVMTWGDAWQVWASAWCPLAQRCHPEEFRQTYHDDIATCQARVQKANCDLAASSHPCDSLFPQERLEWLWLCYEGMFNLACGTVIAPTACYAAFQ